MRNVFDQYEQPENRLTHALMVTLANDKKLVRPFLRFVGAKAIPHLKNIELGLQCVPGQVVDPAKDLSDGLPDGCFFDQCGWAVAIEAKVQSGIPDNRPENQLNRHRRTLAKNGYEQPHVVLVSVDKPKTLPKGVTHIEWKNLYCWFTKRAMESLWAKYFVEYMRVFEAKMIAKDYDIRGTLTMFDGFKFSDSEPYTYAIGKRLIKLLGEELRKRRDLVKEIGLDVMEPGRPAITRGGDESVWDFFPLKNFNGMKFTSMIHPVISLRPKEIAIALTVPDKMKGVRKIIVENDGDGFEKMLGRIEKNFRPILKMVKTAKPMICIYQRHYKSQRSIPEIDGRITVDLRTVLEKAKRPIKNQSGWLECIYKLLANKKSNIQWDIELLCPYSEKIMQSKKAIDVMIDTWIALKPLMDFVTKSNM